ncbi:telomere binding protein [Mortierella sp. GBA35]|nr:telomere binding protein [Mortierella sp. GBA35]
MRPPAKVAFNTFLQRVEAFFLWDSTLQNRPRRMHPDGSIRVGSATPMISTRHSTSEDANAISISPISPSSASHHAVGPMAHSTSINIDQDGALHRRGGTTSMSARGVQSTPSNATVNRSWNTTGTMQIPSLWRRDSWSDAAETFSDESELRENDQHRDDFDSSIHLSQPFQLLLVSRRFADVAIQSLSRNLVFHGHDPYQMESLLGTLHKDDGFLDLDQHRSSSLENLKEMNEKQHDKGKEQMAGVQGASRRHAVDVKGEPAGNMCAPKDRPSAVGGQWQMENGQGAPMSWIESWNYSLRRFSVFQGVRSGVDGPDTEIEANKGSILGCNATFVSQGSGGAGKKHHTTSVPNGHDGDYAFVHAKDKDAKAGSSHDGTLGMNPNEPRWPYRRHVRRVVLNFAHPQASPQMLVRALECIGSRCRGQIQALDLHANEKMQDAGLERPDELMRLFGSGFSKLQHLRLQGGFVDNQLLCALLRNFSSPTSNQPSDPPQEAKANECWSPYEPRIRSFSPAPSVAPCYLSQVFLGPGSVTDSAVEKLIDVAGQSLEVFTVTSCVDVGGGALASLLTKCLKLRVLGVHRSLARDRELLEGLGIPLHTTGPGSQQQQHLQQHQQAHQQLQQADDSNGDHDAPPPVIRKAIVAPLERLELGTVKLTNVGITEILKGTCKTLRFLVLETQHFSEELLKVVISPLCTKLEGLHFDDPEQVQRLQQQMKGLGFSAGRRGPHLPRRHFELGRSGRSFYSDPSRGDLSRPHSSGSRSYRYNRQAGVSGSSHMDRQGGSWDDRSTKVSAWLGETTTDEWVTFGDCALWSSAASPAVSYDNGGVGGPPGGRLPYRHRQHGQPLHQIYHKPAFAMGNAFIPGFNHHHRHQSVSNWFLGDTDELLGRYQVTREMVDEIQDALPKLEMFTVMQLDFVLERKGMYESQFLMRQDEIWVQSAGFRALQFFYLLLFMSTIYFSIFRSNTPTMTDVRDSEAISAYLSDLQSQVRAPSPSLSTVIRLLAEPLSFLGFLPAHDNSPFITKNAATLESLPSSRPVEPTTPRRLYFIQHLLPNHLEFILENITVDWLSALPSAEQTALFDTYFVPSLSSTQTKHGNPLSTAAAMVSLQTLVGRINQRFSENHSFLNKTILRLLKRLLEEYSLLDYFRACCDQIGSASATGNSSPSSAAAAQEANWDPFLSKLFSIPTRVSNAFGASRQFSNSSTGGTDIEQCFQEALFFEQQAIQLQECVRTLSSLKVDGRIQHAKAFGVVIAKLLRLGFGRTLVKSVLSTLWNKDSPADTLGWKLALTATTSTTSQAFLTILIEYLNRNQLESRRFNSAECPQEEVYRAAHLLLTLGYGPGEDNGDMIEEILFQGRVYGSGVLRALICIQSGWPAGAITIFGAGVGNWLELEDFRRKQIGLVVAEEFSKAVDTIGSPADFGLDGADLDVQFTRSLVQLKDGTHSYQPQSHAIDKNTGDSQGPGQGFHGFGTTSGKVQVSDLTDSDDDEDPDAAVDPYSRSHRHLNDDDTSDDDDGDLRPYEMEDESDPDEDVGSARKQKVAAPLYLRDLATYIRANEDREKTEIGLQTATELIRRKAGSLELEEHAEDLANTFVQLQDTFDTSNFFKLREGALVALVVTSPVIVSGVLTFQFYEKKNSLGQRLNILTALALGAQELSGFDQSTLPLSKGQTGTSSKDKRQTTPASASTSLTTQRPTFDNITSAISLSRTRRFSQKSHIEASRPAPKANAFANLAPVFLGGLLGRWGGNRGAGVERGYDALQRAPAMVLKKFVVTLGVLVHYSALVTPTITSLKLPGDGGLSTGTSSSPIATGAPFNADLVESLLFDLLILVTPASGALSDDLLLHEFYVEIVETQQWAMELWESQRLEQGSNDKARMYCAALLQRCFELMKVSM